MAISKAELDDFCERLQALEADKKAIADEMKDTIAAFAECNEFTKKSVAKFFKEWKEAQKDKDEYVLTDYEADQMILIAFPELNSTEVPADVQ